jgi:hypothetical protein
MALRIPFAFMVAAAALSSAADPHEMRLGGDLRPNPKDSALVVATAPV